MNILYYKEKSSQPKILDSSITFNDEDSIEITKKKIIMSLPKEQQPASINEIYLFKMTTINTSALKVLQILSNNFVIPVTYEKLKTFCKNFPNIDRTKIDGKETFEYYDLLDLEFEQPQEIFASLSVYSKHTDFVANPFFIEGDDFTNDVDVNTQFNSLLLDTKQPTDVLYFCLARDLFNHFDKPAHSSYISKTYFPFLFREGIENISQLKGPDAEYNPEYLEKSENILKMIRENNNIRLDMFGVKDMYLKIYPILNINFPLRIVFDYLHASDKYPFIKYNPGMKFENLIKLYTADKKTINEQKIPFLPRKKIIELKQLAGAGNKLTVYIHLPEKDKGYLDNLICEFDHNGVIHITIQLNKSMDDDIQRDIGLMDKIIKENINPLLQTINDYTTQYGYTSILFDTLYDVNVEIVDMTCECKKKVEEIKSIKEILPCLVQSFNYIDEKPTSFSLVFKKISNFAQMEANDQLIMDQFQKTQDITEIIDFLKVNNPDLDDEVVREKVLGVIGDLQQKTEQFENMKFKSVKHPGFPTIGTFEKHQNIDTLHISISKINNINYLNILKKYIHFIFSFFLNNLEPEKIGECRLLKKNEPVIINEIKNIQQETDEFSEFDADSDDDFSDDEDDDDDNNQDMVGGMKTNSLRNPTPFFLKMSAHDEVLFPKQKKGKFTAYSTSCQSQHKRQPVMLTKEEFEKIKKEHPDSFHGWLKYGSSPDKEVYYICPRYWCLKNKTSVSRATLEKEDKDMENGKEGKFGGTKAIIPYNTVPKTIDELRRDQQIYEFTDERFHMDASNNYIDFHPGFLENHKHEKDLAMPCCFQYRLIDKYDPKKRKKVSQSQQDRIKKNAVDYEYGDPSGNIQVFKKDKTLTPTKPASSPNKSVSPEESDAPAPVTPVAPEEPEESDAPAQTPVSASPALSILPSPTPSVTTSISNETKSYRASAYIYKQESVTDIQSVFTPLSENTLGYLPLKLQFFLNFDTTQCFSSSNEHTLKNDTQCILRLGIKHSDKLELQSFVEVITTVYNIVHGKNLPKKEMKDHICDKIIDIDLFVTLQNGNLVQVFHDSSTQKIPQLVSIKKYKNKIKKIEVDEPSLDENLSKNNKFQQIDYDLIEKYSNSKLYKKLAKTNDAFLFIVITAYENFKTYLKSDTEYIDYTYLWDIICSPKSSFFSKTSDDKKSDDKKSDDKKSDDKKSAGINLIILDLTNHDSTNRVEVLCPSNSYSKHIFNKDSNKSLIMIKQTNIDPETNSYYDLFEPIVPSKKNDKGKIVFDPLFENVPTEIKSVINNIKKNLYDKCDPFKMPNIPNKPKFKENVILSELIKKLNKKNILKKIIKYGLSFDFKCVGIKIETDTNKTGFLPCYPSAVNMDDDDKDMMFVDNPKLWSPYKETIDFLTEIKEQDNTILCKHKYFSEESGKIIGLFTETNQFIQFNPPIDNDKINPPISDEFEVVTTDILPNPIEVDEVLFKSNNKPKKITYAHKLKCEQNFLNAFRLLCRHILLSKTSQKMHSRLKLIIDNGKLNYEQKINELSEIIKRLTENNVKFVDYTDDELSKIENVTLCNSNNSKIFCEKDKLKIPKENLITKDDNKKNYLKKISDDLLRHKTTRDFILDPKHLLFFTNEKHSLNSDEILLYESDINKMKFDLLHSRDKSELIMNRPAEDVVSKNAKQYSNEVTEKNDTNPLPKTKNKKLILRN